MVLYIYMYIQSLLHYNFYNTAAIHYLGLVTGEEGKKVPWGFSLGNCTSLTQFYFMEDQNSIKAYT